jgi:hypothetical protein
MVFEDSRQRGHSEGPWMPCLRRFSTVKILPWTRSQQKLLILGSEGSDHISFQILEGGGGVVGLREKKGITLLAGIIFITPTSRVWDRAVNGGAISQIIKAYGEEVV